MHPPPPRLQSLDAYRGFVMFLMAAEVLHLAGLAEHFPGSSFWETIRFHTSHVHWTGCSLHDLIQPSFSFMVGVALPYSLASRMAKGATLQSLWSHALLRSLGLVMLGVILRSIDEPQTKWTFEDTLSQIGLGYPALFALGCFSTRTRWIALVAILLGFWTFFALWSGTGHPTEVWQHHFSGFAAHWNLNANAAWAFDTWFLNLFPRKEPFIANHGGYSTLSFIPTLGTMLLGLFAGQWLRDRTSEGQVLKKLTIAGATCLAVGLISHWSGLCPSVKKIWTPSWTLVSGGWCFLLLASFFFIIDVKGWSRWAYFFIVIGLNSVTIYVMSWTTHSFFAEMLTTHLGHAPFRVFGKAFEHTLHGAAVLAIWWAILHWMHRRKLYLRF